MNSKDLKEKIKLAKDAVEDEQEPYKTEAFKIILGKLLDTSFVPQNEYLESRALDTETVTVNLEDKKMELATKCNITLDELNDIISIKDERVEIIAPLTAIGSDAQKHLIITQCVLIAYEIILGKEWISASELTECLKSSGVKDLSNLAQSLKKQSYLFRDEGIKRNKKYRLTSGEGRKSAFNTMYRLAKGEFSGNK